MKQIRAKKKDFQVQSAMILLTNKRYVQFGPSSTQLLKIKIWNILAYFIEENDKEKVNKQCTSNKIPA